MSIGPVQFEAISIAEANKKALAMLNEDGKLVRSTYLQETPDSRHDGLETVFIPADQIELTTNVLGFGSFGVVKRCYYNGTEVAAKLFLSATVSMDIFDEIKAVK